MIIPFLPDTIGPRLRGRRQPTGDPFLDRLIDKIVRVHAINPKATKFYDEHADTELLIVELERAVAEEEERR